MVDEPLEELFSLKRARYGTSNAKKFNLHGIWTRKNMIIGYKLVEQGSLIAR
jgi:hypothetical protein